MLPIGYNQWLEEILAKVRNHSHVYMIEMRKKDSKWFYLELAPKKDMVQVMWTPRVKHAHIFLTEEVVEEFKADYISPRKVSIIRMPSVEVLLTL